MFDFLPYFTNDGSVGLYSKQIEDIYHSSYGALTEAYLKFILPANIDNFLLNNNNLKVLDICYGIGYNSKSVLNCFLRKTLLSDKKNYKKFFQKKNISQKKYNYIATIDADNILEKKSGILIHAVDINKNLMKISPFMKTHKKKFDTNKNVSECIKQVLKKSNKKRADYNFKIAKEVDMILIIKLIKQFGNEFLDEETRKILTDKNFSLFFDKNMLEFAKFYQNSEYKTSSKLIKTAYLHNIYYKYISLRYKKVLEILKNHNININFFNKDARTFIVESELTYDVIFLDAFTPSKCPNLWTVEFFNQLYEHLDKDGIILTYSNSAAVRNAFLQNNFYVGKIFNKFENKFTGTVACKNSNLITDKLDDYDLGLINSKAGIAYKDKNLNSDNDTIINNRNLELKKSMLLSSTQFIKEYKELKNGL